MLEDRPRTLAYKNAIETNDAVKNKIVLGKDEIYKIKSNSKLLLQFVEYLKDLLYSTFSIRCRGRYWHFVTILHESWCKKSLCG